MKATNMTYKITLFNHWNEPYYKSDSSQTCDTENYESFTTTSLDLCKQIVKDLLDAPVAELTLEQIHQDFDNGNEVIAEKNAIAIQMYYNGRLAMLNAILDDLSTAEIDDVLHYDIPEAYNRFEVIDDESAKLSKQIQAYLEIQIS